MKNTKKVLRSPASALLAALLLTTACGGESPEGASTGPPPPSPEEAGISADLLSGFVLFHEFQDDVFLTFHNVDDGVQKLSLDLSELAHEEDVFIPVLYWHDFAFSPDFRHAAYEGVHGMRVAELDDESFSYTLTATLAPEEASTFSGGKITYETPQFSPDGSELWFEEVHEKSEQDSRLLAVDSADPTSGAPEPKGEVSSHSSTPHQFEGAALNGKKTDLSAPKSAYTISDSNELQVLSKKTTEDDAALEYLAGESEIIPWNFLRNPSGGFLGPLDSANVTGLTSTAYTKIYSFDMTADGEISNKEVVIENAANGIGSLWTDPQENRLILRANGSYYQHPFGASGEPTEIFSEFTFEGPTADSSSAKDILGIFPNFDD